LLVQAEKTIKLSDFAFGGNGGTLVKKSCVGVRNNIVKIPPPPPVLFSSRPHSREIFAKKVAENVKKGRNLDLYPFG